MEFTTEQQQQQGGREEEDNDDMDEDDVTNIRLLCGQHPDAMEENKGMVEFMASVMYLFRKKNFTHASERLKNYLEWRRKLFGDLKDQSFDENPKLKEQIESMCMRILPESLPSGEAVVYMELRRHRPADFTAADTVKSWHYLILTTIKKRPDLARRGFVLAGNMSEAGYGNMDIGVPESIASAVNNCMPLRMHKFFFINPPFVARMVIPVVKLILSKKLGERVHVITDASELYSTHDMNPSYLPEAIGGQVTDAISKTHINNLLAENIRI